MRVARQLFENNGFNALCKSLCREFQKLSSKVVEQDHAKLLFLTWFALRLHRILSAYVKLLYGLLFCKDAFHVGVLCRLIPLPLPVLI